MYVSRSYLDLNSSTCGWSKLMRSLEPFHALERLGNPENVENRIYSYYETE